jgi:hypothetical protein
VVDGVRFRHLGTMVWLMQGHLRGPSMNKVIAVGLDIGKYVFQVHGVDAAVRQCLPMARPAPLQDPIRPGPTERPSVPKIGRCRRAWWAPSETAQPRLLTLSGPELFEVALDRAPDVRYVLSRSGPRGSASPFRALMPGPRPRCSRTICPDNPRAEPDLGRGGWSAP